ncbi:MAG: asparagine--tRNA ligase [Clostridiales bacterium]|jgi:asparaginyl-tRNA synthetase|nr:asparagine--tRNA ligase [Clostridiales bacterium]
MMIRIRELLKQPDEFIGQTVTIGGWIKTIRDNKNFGFMEINDGSFFKNIQVVLSPEVVNFNEAVKLGVGSSVTVEGVVVESPGQGQTVEVKASAVQIENAAPADYPLQKKRHSFEYLRTIAHLRPRTNTFAAVFRVRSLAAYAIHEFFQARDFVYVHTPILTASDCEGAGEMFQATVLDMNCPPKTPEGRIDYQEDFFGKMTKLTVSGQLSAETFALALRDVYTFGPTFRAENSNTPRHAAEFWMIEPEIAFAGLDSNMKLAEDLLKHVIRMVLEKAPEEMAFLNAYVDKGLLVRLRAVLDAAFGVVTYTEAVEILREANHSFAYPVSWGMDLQTEHERYLTEEFFKRPVFVIHYPKEIKPFYMRLNDDGRTVAAMDLLTPGIGEIIGGSQREERLSVLQRRMAEFQLPEKEYWWYLDLRKYGSVKHAGFGMGFERCVMYLTGMQNIRDVIPYPRTPGSAEF